MTYDGERYGIAYTKLNDDVVLSMIECGMMLYSISESCRVCDITPQTYYNWMRKAKHELDEYGEIQTALLKSIYHAHEKGKITRLSMISDVVFRGALIDPDLGLKVLERHSKQWSNKVEQKIEVTQKQEIKIDASSMTDDQIEEQLKRIALNKESEGE